MHILVGDIGGTNTRLRLLQCQDGACVIRHEQRYDSPSFPGLADILKLFLPAAANDKPSIACFALAGPVQQSPAGQKARLTNLPWELDSQLLERDFSFRSCQLINDFAAVAYGIDDLMPDEIVELQAGRPDPNGVRAVLGAGTGLGQAILLPETYGAQVLSTEGGHVDYGATSAIELDLSRWLMEHRGRASYEDILSGPGLCRLYAFLCQRAPASASQALLQSLSTDGAAAVTRAALDDRDPLAGAALDLFVRIYGAQAGNLALASGATGGLYVAGGIAPQLIDHLRNGSFMQAFRNKGAMASYVTGIPVRVVLAAYIGLRGAKRAALRLMSLKPGRERA